MYKQLLLKEIALSVSPVLGSQHKLWLTFYNFVGEDRGDGGPGVSGVGVGGLVMKNGRGSGDKNLNRGVPEKNWGKKWDEGKEEKNG